MNTIEACSLLGISVGATTEEVTKAFRTKALELHPDRNKAEDAEAKFKQMNEAYQFLQKYGTSASSSTYPNHGTSTETVFYRNGVQFRYEQQYSTADAVSEELYRRLQQLFNQNFAQVEPIAVAVEVSFEEAILGTKKQAKYSRRVPCHGCDGRGIQVTQKYMCTACGGTGYRKYPKTNIDIQDNTMAEDKTLPCTKCKSKGYIGGERCTVCKNIRHIIKEETIEIEIPAGVQNGQQLLVKNVGHWTQHAQFNRVEYGYGNLTVFLRVLKSEKFTRSGLDVVSTLDITLEEALSGTKKSVETVQGPRTLSIKPGVKHKDVLKINGFGAPPTGAHLFVLNVIYPDDAKSVIEALNNNASEQERPQSWVPPKVEEEKKDGVQG